MAVRLRVFGALVFVILVSAVCDAGRTAAAQTATASLRIVVIKGEDAVNIIQQKTAVAPVVEIRDRNNLPVPGATVTFSIGGQGASFGGGLQTITVTTNAAGQAAAAGLTPTATGAIQINATAAFQGQTVAATITQTNFATAQAAAQAAASATGTGGATTASTASGAGSAAGGGGLSNGAILGIVGGAGAAAAGAVVATQSGGSDETVTTTTTTNQGTPPTCTERPSTQGSGNAPFEGNFQLGRSSGTFDFRYDSGNFEDQFIVIYEGRTLFDTGCVGTGAGVSRTQAIGYSGSATMVTVRVNPNCTNRPDNPYWNFSVSCPR